VKWLKEKLIYEFFKRKKRDDPVVEQSPVLAPLTELEQRHD
jgi:hypothetical protein